MPYPMTQLDLKLTMMNLLRSLARKLIPSAIRYRIYVARHDIYKNVKPLFKTFQNTLYRKVKVTNVIYRHKASFHPILKYCVNNIEIIDAPLILISQIQRSGGSLLSQLFDGHPSLLVHPHELKIGHPKNADWPKFSSSDNPSKLFTRLFEHNNILFMRNGYAKGKRQIKRHRFYFIPSLQREIFLSLCNDSKVLTDRHILNAYFTSYFNAWLNYRGSLRGKYVLAFAPRLASDQKQFEDFFTTYPDGKLISILREPYSWFASVTTRNPEKLIDNLIKIWNESTCAMIRNKKSNSDNVILLKFEDLISDSEKTMINICRQIGLDYNDVLLTPTFNSEPITANSSFTVKEEGISNEPINRKQYLDTNEIKYIERECTVNYQNALNYIDSI